MCRNQASRDVFQDDWRALTPSIYGRIHPYGWFDLDLTKRLAIELLQAA